MQYLTVIDHSTNKEIGFLGKARDIGYRLEHNAVWSASFALPLNDPKNSRCRVFNYIRLYDGDREIGLFRIIQQHITKNASTKLVVYECEHVIATLMDDILFGWHEIGNLGHYTDEIIRYVLDHQTTPRWQLGECDFRHQFQYGWENENLLKALFSIATPFLEDYRWEYNTATEPWTVSLKAAPTKAKAEIRYRKNMLGIEQHIDSSNLCTRLYPLGFGEGVNQLTIKSVEPNGRKYIDADTINEHGIITKIWIDQRYQHAQSLYDAGREMLESLKNPAVSYSISSRHNKELLESEVGDMIRVADDDLGVDIMTRVLAIDKGDVTGAPQDATFTIANKGASVASTIADLSDRQRIGEAYSQGATSLFTTHFYDNCAPSYPATMRFYIPPEAVHINQILLNAQTAAFRGYSKTTKGGGGTSRGSSTSSGGGATATTEATDLPSSNIVADDQGGQNAKNHNHGIAAGVRLAVVNNSNEITGSVGWTPSGAHGHGKHKHDVPIPKHSHNFTVEIDDHTHDIEYGIYTGTTANTLTLKVDGRTVPGAFARSIDNIDIIDYLDTDNGGNINRGWHEIAITPDELSRVEADLVIQLFANSRGGGQY